ncbi:MAG: 6-pyruvoyl trahydropterin synthase family protein [Planctomycetota bacterium]|nr:6-carboxytetrahydropterin synthase [Planctomycetota bacterium]
MSPTPEARADAVDHATAATSLALLRQLRFCAGHRLWRHESKCAYLHGHNYRVDVEVVAAAGAAAVDPVGRIVDFSLIKRRLLGWLDDHWDHAFILFVDDAEAIAAVRLSTPSKLFLLPWNPTAENMARYLLEVVCPAVLADLGVIAREVRVWESEESCAIASRTGSPPAPPVPPGTAEVVDRR